MKKLLIFILSILLLCLLFCLTSCNKQIFDFNYTFKKVHILETNKCYNLSSWRDYDGEQLQLNLEDYGICLFYSNQVILIVDKCPICEDK